MSQVEKAGRDRHLQSPRPGLLGAALPCTAVGALDHRASLRSYILPWMMTMGS